MKNTFKKSDYKNLSPDSVEKIFCVLEEIKQEAELIPQQRQKKIKFPITELCLKCRISSNQIENILAKLKQEELINEFRFFYEGI